MEFDSLVSILGLILVVLVNIITIASTYGKVATRLTHAESDIISLQHSDELHNQELKSIHVIEGQLKTLIEFIKKG